MKTATIDRAGRITLPAEALRALGISAEAEVVVESTDDGVLIRAKASATPLTDAISAMDLPVADWERMESESEAGRCA